MTDFTLNFGDYRIRSLRSYTASWLEGNVRPLGPMPPPTKIADVGGAPTGLITDALTSSDRVSSIIVMPKITDVVWVLLDDYVGYGSTDANTVLIDYDVLPLGPTTPAGGNFQSAHSAPHRSQGVAWVDTFPTTLGVAFDKVLISAEEAPGYRKRAWAPVDPTIEVDPLPPDSFSTIIWTLPQGTIAGSLITIAPAIKWLGFPLGAWDTGRIWEPAVWGN